MRPLPTVVCLLAAAGAAPAWADVVTDGTVGPRVRLGGDFEIGAELGRRAGRNLFHSFERFSLDAGERATFTGPDQIRNVMSRVTGGERSDIDGTLRSTIPGADFYFFNPAGVVFGPNASLDLQGSFHVSTADELRFADGAKFSASTPAASSLTVASPEAFGFLGSSPNPILVDRSTLAVQSERTLSFVGGDIDISGGVLTTMAGEVNLLALGGRGTARVTGNVGATGDRADIALRNQSRIETTGDGGGTIRIRGGAIVVEGGSMAFADNTGPSDSQGGIAIDGRRLELRDGSLLTADVVGDGTGRGGEVSVRAAKVAITDGSRLAADTFAEGNAGTVTVTAEDLVVRGGFVRSASQGAGDAGTVTVTADRVALLEGGQFISSPLGDSRGAGGEVQVAARDSLLIAGRDPGGIPSGIFAIAEGDVDSDQDAGSVTVSARSLTITDGAVITSSTLTGGNAGSVTVTARELVVVNQGKISSNTFATGNAGRVTVDAGRLLIDGGGFSAGTAFSTGILSEAQTLVTADGQVVVAEGNAGAVTVRAGELEVRNAGKISSLTLGEGDAGEVTVDADRLLIDGQGSPFATGILSDANPFVSSDGRHVVAGGDAGTVTVTANQMRLVNGGVITSDTQGKGDGGNIVIHAREALHLDAGFIGASSRKGATDESGSAGTVTIHAGRIEFVNDGRIFNGTDTTGDGGDITVHADTIVADLGSDPTGFHTGISASANAGSSGSGGDVTVIASQITLINGAEITSDTQGEGHGGDVVVYAREALNLDGGFIGTSSREGATETGDAGTVTIRADRIEFVNDGRIFNGTDTAGNGGNITVRARTIFADVGSDPTEFHTGISASANPTSSGSGGNVTVTADRIRLINGAEISSDTDSSGAAGTVTVSAEQIELKNGGQIFTTSSSTGDAGSVALSADRLEINAGRITTDTVFAGRGEIQLLVNDVVDFRNSAVTTSVAGGADPTAGNILIDPKVLVIDGSRIEANAPAGFGGRVTIVADNILVPGGDFEALLARGDISASGGDPTRAGSVVVSAPEVDLAGGLVVLEGALLDAASQLRERCGARRDIGASSFTGVGRGGLPASPDAPLSGPYEAVPQMGRVAGGDRPATIPALSDHPALPAAPCLGAP